jgi:hypothetical protein
MAHAKSLTFCCLPALDCPLVCICAGTVDFTNEYIALSGSEAWLLTCVGAWVGGSLRMRACFFPERCGKAVPEPHVFALTLIERTRNTLLWLSFCLYDIPIFVCDYGYHYVAECDCYSVFALFLRECRLPPAIVYAWKPSLSSTCVPPFNFTVLRFTLRPSICTRRSSMFNPLSALTAMS